MKGKQLVLFDIALGSETAREELVNDTNTHSLKYDWGGELSHFLIILGFLKA